MDDDFNTAGGLAAIFSLVTSANTYLADAGTAAGGVAAKTAADALAELTGALGVTLKAEEDEPPAELVDLAAKYAGYTGDSAAEAADALIAARQAARKAKDWGTADGIRDAITGLGLVLEDTAAGSRLRKA
jgi:cysteinyl-tRNA synthetase